MKISLTIDLSKIDKNRIINRTYTNSEGVEVTSKDYKIDVVPLNQDKRKVLKEGDTWRMVKTHFVCDTSTKEERENKTKTNFLGSGICFEDKNPTDGVDYPQEEITDVPF